MEFDEEKAENELADSYLDMPEGELEVCMTGNPTVVWNVLQYCSIERLPMAIERVWQACWLNVQDDDLDLAEEIGRAMVFGLSQRVQSRRGPSDGL